MLVYVNGSTLCSGNQRELVYTDEAVEHFIGYFLYIIRGITIFLANEVIKEEWVT